MGRLQTGSVNLSASAQLKFTCSTCGQSGHLTGTFDPQLKVYPQDDVGALIDLVQQHADRGSEIQHNHEAAGSDAEPKVGPPDLKWTLTVLEMNSPFLVSQERGV